MESANSQNKGVRKKLRIVVVEEEETNMPRNDFGIQGIKERKLSRSKQGARGEVKPGRKRGFAVERKKRGTSRERGKRK